MAARYAAAGPVVGRPLGHAERRLGARCVLGETVPASIAVGSHAAFTPARSGALIDSG